MLLLCRREFCWWKWLVDTNLRNICKTRKKHSCNNDFSSSSENWIIVKYLGKSTTSYKDIWRSASSTPLSAPTSSTTSTANNKPSSQKYSFNHFLSLLPRLNFIFCRERKEFIIPGAAGCRRKTYLRRRGGSGNKKRKNLRRLIIIYLPSWKFFHLHLSFPSCDGEGA